MYHTWRELSKATAQTEEKNIQTSLSASNSGADRRPEQPLTHKAG
jgi:hypothetical protein